MCWRTLTQSENFKITLNFKPHLDDNNTMNNPPEEACDRCSVHVPNGDGHYTASEDDRLCYSCFQNNYPKPYTPEEPALKQYFVTWTATTHNTTYVLARSQSEAEDLAPGSLDAEVYHTEITGIESERAS